MFTVILALCAWAFLCYYSHKHPICDVSRGVRGGGGSDTSVDIPSYNKPAASSFDMFGTTGAYDSGTNTYKSTMSPSDMATYTAVKQIRGDLLKSLGLSGASAESDPYAGLLLNESLKTTQPKLENALIGRGLGGSTVYKDAVTDLLSKLGTQATLGSQQYKLNNLAALQSYLSGENALGQYLLNATRGNDINQQQLAQQMYLAQLPYLSQVNQDSGMDWSGLGSLLGTGAGALLALPTGGMSVLGGAQLGGLLGGGLGKVASTF